MVEQQSHGSRMPLGDDLMAGRPLDTAASDRSPRVKRRLRGKTSLAEIERLERGRSRALNHPV